MSRFRHDPGVAPTLLAALSTMERHGLATAGSLTAHGQVERPCVIRLLASLESRGFIERIGRLSQRERAKLRMATEILERLAEGAG